MDHLRKPRLLLLSNAVSIPDFMPFSAANTRYLELAQIGRVQGENNPGGGPTLLFAYRQVRHRTLLKGVHNQGSSEDTSQTTRAGESLVKLNTWLSYSKWLNSEICFGMYESVGDVRSVSPAGRCYRVCLRHNPVATRVACTTRTLGMFRTTPESLLKVVLARIIVYESRSPGCSAECLINCLFN